MTDNKPSTTSPNQPQTTKNMPRLQLLGQELITTFGLAKFRREFRFDTRIIQASSDPEICEFVNTKLAELGIPAKLQELGISGNPQVSAADMEIIRREFSADGNKTGLGWHIDDCQLVVKSTPPEYSTERFIHLFDDRWLYISGARARIPRWTMILYLSTEGPTHDFTGGLLRLADGTKYRPEAGLGLLIDSREVHMVSPVRRGQRKSIIIKIY